MTEYKEVDLLAALNKRTELPKILVFSSSVSSYTKGEGMKRINICSLIFLFILVGSLPVYASDQTVSIAYESSDNGNGEYAVSVIGTGLENIAMIQFTISYDKTAARCLGYSAGDIYTGNLLPTVNTSIPGEIVFVWDSLQPLTSDGTLFTFTIALQGNGAANFRINADEELIFCYEDFSPADIETSPFVIEGIMDNDVNCKCKFQSAE
ncbi:MAG: hypothetical protein HUJ69_04015 [Lachnospiraceae bacterium]|nr:hypothetical protein [Lachnospiraceae bacterium]